MLIKREEIVKAVATLIEAIKTDEGKQFIKELNIKFSVIEVQKIDGNEIYNVEKWQDIEGYDGDYQVSNLGNVRTRKHHNTWLPLKCHLTNTGYYAVRLSNNGKTKYHLVHILVAQAFIPNPENKPEVNHKFGNKTDNRACMLEWVTYSENAIHAYRNGLRKSKRGMEHYNAKFKEEQIKYIRENYKTGDRIFGIKPLAEKFKVGRDIIRAIVNHKTYQDIE